MLVPAERSPLYAPYLVIARLSFSRVCAVKLTIWKCVMIISNATHCAVVRGLLTFDPLFQFSPQLRQRTRGLLIGVRNGRYGNVLQDGPKVCTCTDVRNITRRSKRSGKFAIQYQSASAQWTFLACQPRRI